MSNNNGMSEVTYKITEHARQRYVERVIGKTDILEVNRYIASNGDKIAEDINKLLKYAKEVYRGKNPRPNKINTSDIVVLMKDAWVLIVGKDNNNLVTLFKLGLGVNDEKLDAMYADRLAEQLEQVQTEITEERKRTLSENEIFRENIKENNALIAKKQKEIKVLEAQNDGYNKVINGNNEKNKMLDDKLDVVMDKIVSKTRNDY
jgi:hypothetical protein